MCVVVIPRSRTRRRNEAKQERKGRSKNESFTLVHGAKEAGRVDGSFRSFSNEMSGDDASRKSVSRHSPLFCARVIISSLSSRRFFTIFLYKSKFFRRECFVQCRYIDRRRDFVKVPKKIREFREKIRASAARARRTGIEEVKVRPKSRF